MRAAVRAAVLPKGSLFSGPKGAAHEWGVLTDRCATGGMLVVLAMGQNGAMQHRMVSPSSNSAGRCSGAAGTFLRVAIGGESAAVFRRARGVSFGFCAPGDGDVLLARNGNAFQFVQTAHGLRILTIAWSAEVPGFALLGDLLAGNSIANKANS